MFEVYFLKVLIVTDQEVIQSELVHCKPLVAVSVVAMFLCIFIRYLFASIVLVLIVYNVVLN